MVASGRLAFTWRLFLGVLVTIYLLFALLLPGEESHTTLEHLLEDLDVKPGEGCDGEVGCQNVKTGEEAGEEEAEKEENARLKEENAKIIGEHYKLKEVPAVEQAKPWISANTDVNMWIGRHFCFLYGPLHITHSIHSSISDLPNGEFVKRLCLGKGAPKSGEVWSPSPFGLFPEKKIW